jgi:DNA-binding NarL/FixJ family response regulator
MLRCTVLHNLMNTAPKRTRILLADDHAAMLGKIVRLLEGEFEIAGTVGNGLDLVEAASRLDPDVVVLDISMPGMDGIEAARRLKRAQCRAKLVFLTVHDDPDYMRAAIEAGGTAYVVKSRLASDLIAAIHAALAGRTFFSPTVELGEKP